MGYTLAEDGDPVEQQHWELFLRDEFPSYETVWAGYIVPLTLRPDHPGFKSNEALARIGRGEEDIANAQLHYTTFTHLVRVFTLKQAEFGNTDQFIEAIVRLAAATDVADELLERMTKRGHYPPWDESSAARRSWRKARGRPMQHLRNYRNRLLHGGLVPFQLVRQMDRIEGGELVPQDPVFRFPKIGREADYLDWRTLVGPGAVTTPIVLHRDFAAAETIVDGAWEETLDYFETEWQRTLVPMAAAAGC